MSKRNRIVVISGCLAAVVVVVVVIAFLPWRSPRPIRNPYTIEFEANAKKLCDALDRLRREGDGAASLPTVDRTTFERDSQTQTPSEEVVSLVTEIDEALSHLPFDLFVADATQFEIFAADFMATYQHAVAEVTRRIKAVEEARATNTDRFSHCTRLVEGRLYILPVNRRMGIVSVTGDRTYSPLTPFERDIKEWVESWRLARAKSKAPTTAPAT